jgi:hypothetical protein
MLHSLVFLLSAIVLVIWLVFAWLLSGQILYVLGALLVASVLVFSLRQK